MIKKPLAMLPRIDFTQIEIEEGEYRESRGRPVPGQLSMRAYVRNRFDGTPLEINFGATLPEAWSHMPESVRAQWLRSQMLNLAAHEIDEMLFLAGLGRDPHKPEISLNNLAVLGKVSL